MHENSKAFSIICRMLYQQTLYYPLIRGVSHSPAYSQSLLAVLYQHFVSHFNRQIAFYEFWLSLCKRVNKRDVWSVCPTQT